MEAVLLSAYMILAVGFAIGSVAYLAVALTSISSRLEAFEKWLPIILIAMAGLLMCASGLLNARNLQFASAGAGFIDTDRSPAYLWLSRLMSLVLLGLALPYFIAKALKDFSYRNPLSWPLIILVFFGLTCFVLPGFLGAIPYFDHRALYPVIVMIAIHLAAKRNTQGTLLAIKWSTMVFLTASLAFLVIDYSRVMAPGYRGWIPGLSSRFWGLAPHANAIGPMATLAILLELLCPSHRRIVRLAVFIGAALVLILAQSKTAIGATLIGLGIVLYARIADQKKNASEAAIHLHKGHLFLLCSAIFGCLAFLVLGNLGLLDKLLTRLELIGVTNSVYSMSGRTIIWEAALREFDNNPLFGFGPTLWDETYRRAIGLNYAYHAHNQILQTMAQSGTSGLLGLLAFLLLAILRAFQTYRITNGVSVAMLCLLGFRVVTEVPLSPVGIGNGEMLAIAAMICIWHLANKPIPSIQKSKNSTACPLPNSAS